MRTCNNKPEVREKETQGVTSKHLHLIFATTASEILHYILHEIQTLFAAVKTCRCINIATNISACWRKVKTIQGQIDVRKYCALY